MPVLSFEYKNNYEVDYILCEGYVIIEIWWAIIEIKLIHWTPVNLLSPVKLHL